MTQPPKDLRKFESFVAIVEALRGPQGCPWDKEQTHRSLTPYVIEEAHELADAIENGDERETVLELGDVLLQVVLHAEIGRQAGRFDIHDVIEGISQKMVRRHPHVFSTAEVADSAEVLANWAEIKAQEKSEKQNSANALKESPAKFDVPSSLPALARSQKIGDRTKRVRFDWPDAQSVLEKVDEELAELKSEMMKGDAATKHELEHEIGDLLFSVSQLARHLGLEAEQCLRTANNRFEKRFFTMKSLIAAKGVEYDSLSSSELEQAWQETKVLLKAEES